MPENEYFVEFQGAGFIAGHAGIFANCRVVFENGTNNILRVEPLGGAAPASPEPEQPVEQPVSQVEQPIQPVEEQAPKTNGG